MNKSKVLIISISLFLSCILFITSYRLFQLDNEIKICKLNGNK